MTGTVQSMHMLDGMVLLCEVSLTHWGFEAPPQNFEIQAGNCTISIDDIGVVSDTRTLLDWYRQQKAPVCVEGTEIADSNGLSKANFGLTPVGPPT